MNRTTNRAGICVSGVSLSLLVLLCVSFWAQAKDDKFDLLKTKTAVYTNVTVTSKSETDIYIFHSTGICNLKVADLPPGLAAIHGRRLDAEQAEVAATRRHCRTRPRYGRPRRAARD